ncbi:sphingolipid delta-4 desaturase [Salinihabitans flavidus]|uniref:Sphingolipid delta-4 desaturase n=1 Tax=Salinihabitans flavidus TaxID=569882 RepID=A0A1H8TVN4_9RHOB|nr:fatty acid desaturase [Salinihabitans flavidus]SEO95072.1 sphingolipid delta-4 desaturase [Salinihabitans flavidus]
MADIRQAASAQTTVESDRASISPQSRRHLQMRKEALAGHPELRRLSGPDRRTVLAVPVLLAVHWGVAWAVSGSNLLVVFLAAFCLGQFVIHAAGSLVHETAHRLIFRGNRAKLAFDLGLETILASFGKQLIYQHEHLSSHHPFIGDYERDYEHEDLCAFKARDMVIRDHPRLQRVLTVATLIVHLLPFGFIISDEIFPRLYKRLTGHEVHDRQRRIGASSAPRWQMRLFIGWSLAMNVALLLLFGVWGWLYHNWALSIFLGKFGISNLGQSLSEHAGDDVHTPTRSTYGWVNRLFFNTGYHNEHHTFPNVAWTRLPDLAEGAPEVFSARADKSYLGYWWDHVRGDFKTSRRSVLQDQDQSDRCPKVRAGSG